MTELTYNVGLLCPVRPATLKDWEGNPGFVFCWFNCCAGCFWLTMRDLFVLWIQSLTSKHPVHLLLSLPCKWKRKKGKIPTSETYLSKDSRQTMSKAMLSQMCHWISMLSLCEAFIGLQCRRQHFCLIFTAIILALPYINPLYFQLDKLHATIVLWLMPFSTSPSLQWWKGSQVNVQLHGQLFWLPLPDRVVDFFVFFYDIFWNNSMYENLPFVKKIFVIFILLCQIAIFHPL